MKGSRKKANIDEDLTSVLNSYYYIYIIHNIPSISNCELEVVAVVLSFLLKNLR